MRQGLADHARTSKRERRGGGRSLCTETSPNGTASTQTCARSTRALGELARLNPRHAREVELRVLGGLTIAETAARALELDPPLRPGYLPIGVQRLPSLALLGGFPSGAPIPVMPFGGSGASLYAASKSGTLTRPS